MSDCMNPKTKNKIFVGIVAFIFIGSMAGALLYSTGDENKNPEIPTEHILTQLSDNQKQFMISQGYIIIDAQIPNVCYLDCAGAKRALKQAATAYNPAVFVVEKTVQSDRDIIIVSADSFRGKMSPAAFNQTEIDAFICENTPFRLNECVLRKIDFGKEIPLGSAPSNTTNAGNETQNTDVSVNGAQNISANSTQEVSLNGTNSAQNKSQ